jgi:hypothetical protein
VTAPSSIALRRVAVASLAALGLIIWGMYSFQPYRTTDFIQDYAASQALREGTPIYGENINRIAQELFATDKIENFHPPSLSILLLPLSYLPFPAAFLLFNAIALLLYWYLVRTVWVELELPIRYLLPTFSGLLLWFPFVTCIASGQSSLLIAGLAVYAWRSLRHDRDAVAGAALGVASLIKLFPLLYVMPLVLQRRFVAATAMIGTFASGVIVTVWVTGIDTATWYVEHVVRRDVIEWGVYPINVSLTGVIYPLFLRNGWVAHLFESVETASLVVTVGSGMLLGITAYRLLRRSGSDYPMHLTTITMLLVSPITWVHIFPILLPAIGYLVVAARSYRWVILACLALSIPDTHFMNLLMSLVSPSKIPGPLYLLSKLPTAGLVVLWWQVARTEARSGPRSAV